MPRILTQPVRDEIAELFELYDEDLEGTIVVANAVTILRALDFNPSNQYIEQMEKKFNDNFNGRVSLEDIYNICSDDALPAQGPTDEDLKKAFSAFDNDGNGTIDRAELTKALLTMGEAMSTTEVDRLFSDLDKNDDGKLDYKEFLTVLNPEQFQEQKKKALDSVVHQEKTETKQEASATSDTPEPKTEPPVLDVDSSQIALPDNWHFRSIIKRITDYTAQRSRGDRWSAEKGEEALAAGDHSKADLSSTLQDNLKSIDSFKVKVQYVARGGFRPVVSRFGIQGPPSDLEYHQLCMTDMDGTSLRPHGWALDVSSVSAAGTMHWGDCNRTPSFIGTKEDQRTDSKVVKSYLDLITPVNPACFKEDVDALERLKSKINGKDSDYGSNVMPKPILFLEQTPSLAWQEYSLLALENLGQCNDDEVDSSKLEALVDGFNDCDVYYREETTGYTPLAFAIAVKGSPSLIQKLVRVKHSLVIHPYSPSESPVHLACEHGTVDQLKAIMEAGGGAFHPSILSRTYHGHASPLEQLVARRKKGSSSKEEMERRASFFSYLIPLLAPHRSAIQLLPFHTWASQQRAGIADLPKIWASVARQCTPPRTESLRFVTAGGLLHQVIASSSSSPRKEALLQGVLDVMTLDEISEDRTWQNGSVLHTASSSGDVGSVTAILQKVPALLLVVDAQDRFPLTVALNLKKSSHRVVQALLNPTLSALEKHHSSMIKGAGGETAFRNLFWHLVERGLEKEAERLWDWMEISSAIGLDWYNETLARSLDSPSLIQKVLLSCRVDPMTFLDFAEIALASSKGKTIIKPTVDEILRCSFLQHKGYQIVKAAMRGEVEASLMKKLWDFCIPTEDMSQMESAWSTCDQPQQLRSFDQYCFPLIEMVPDSFKNIKVREAWGRSLLKIFSTVGFDFGGLKPLFDRCLSSEVRYKLLVDMWTPKNTAQLQKALIQLLQDDSIPPIPGDVAVRLMSTGGPQIHFFSGKNSSEYTTILFEHLASRKVELGYRRLSPGERAKSFENDSGEVEDGEWHFDHPNPLLCLAAPCAIGMKLFKDCMARCGTSIGDYVLNYFARHHTPPSDDEFLEDLSIQGSLLSDYKTFLQDAGAFPSWKLGCKMNHGVSMLAHIKWQLDNGGLVQFIPEQVSGTFHEKPEKLPNSIRFQRLVIEASLSCSSAAKTYWTSDEDKELQGENDEFDEPLSLPKRKTLYPLLLAQRLVQLGATKKYLEPFLFLFPEAAHVIANVAACLQKTEIASYAISAASSESVKLIPTTNAAINAAVSSGSKKATFTEKCYSVQLSKEKRWELQQHDSLAAALFSPLVDAAHFEKYVQHCNSTGLFSKPLTTGWMMVGSGFTCSLSKTLSALEHLKIEGIGFQPHKAVDPHARYKNHWLTTVIADPLGSSTHGPSNKISQTLIDESKKNLEGKISIFINQAMNVSGDVGLELLSLCILRGLNYKVTTAVLQSEPLQKLEDKSGLHRVELQSWMMRVLSAVDLKEALKYDQIELKSQVVKSIILDDRHVASRSDLLKYIAKSKSVSRIDFQGEVAPFAIRHCSSDKDVDVVFDALSLEHHNSLILDYAKGNKLSYLKKLPEAQVKTEFGSLLNTLLLHGHSGSAVKFVQLYDSPSCDSLLTELNQFFDDFEGCNWVGKHVLYSGCNGTDPSFFKFVFDPSGPLASQLTEKHYQIAAYALLRICRAQSHAEYLEVLIKARSSIPQLQSVEVSSLEDRIGEDEEEEDGANGGDGPTVCPIANRPSCPLPDRRVSLFLTAGYSRTLLQIDSSMRPSGLISMVQNDEELGSINIDLTVRTELESRLGLEQSVLPLCNAAQKNTKVRDALVKIAPSLPDHLKERFNKFLFAQTKKPSELLYLFPPLCGDSGFTQEDWVELVMRAASNCDKVFFEKMTETGRWSQVPDRIPAESVYYDEERSNSEVPRQPLIPSIADTVRDNRPLVEEILGGNGNKAVSEKEFKKWAHATFVGLPESTLTKVEVDLSGASGITLTKLGLLKQELSSRIRDFMYCVPTCSEAIVSDRPQKASTTSRTFAALFSELVCNAMSLKVSKRASLEITSAGHWVVTVGDSSDDTHVIDFEDGSHTSDVVEAICHLSTHLMSNKIASVVDFNDESGRPPYATHHSHTFLARERELSEETVRKMITEDTTSGAVWLRVRGLLILLDYYWPLPSDEMRYEYPLQLLTNKRNRRDVKLWNSVEHRASPGVAPPLNNCENLTVVAPSEEVSKKLIQVGYHQPITQYPGVRERVTELITNHSLGPVFTTDHLDGHHTVSEDPTEDVFVF